MRKWLASSLIASTVTLAMPSLGAARYQSEGDLVRIFHLPPSLGMIYRKASGDRVTKNEFFRQINAGTPFHQDGIIHVQRAVFTLGNDYNAEQPPAGQVTMLKVGDSMPRLRKITLRGAEVSNKMFMNRLTVIDFFGVDCGACIDEIPVLNAFKANHPDIQTLAVTMDAAEYVGDLVKHQPFTWTIVPDAIGFVQGVGTWFAPTYALVDQKGRLLAATSAGSLHAPGERLSSEDIARWVDRYQHSGQVVE